MYYCKEKVSIMYYNVHIIYYFGPYWPLNLKFDYVK